MNFAFMSATREVDGNEIPLGKSLQLLKKIRPDIHTIRASENEIGLSNVYNSYISSYSKLKDEDWILIFVHDDVWINDVFIFEKLEKAMTEFDIVGLAGTSSNLRYRPVLWHNAPRESLSGAVAHAQPKGQFSFNFFGLTPRECKYVDGVFIAVNLKKIIEAEVTFDEDFDFHFYDLAFCKRACDKGLRIGTWPIWVTHESVGDFNKEEWKESETKFIKKYL